MYFDFGDYRPETPTVESAISRREGVLLSVVLHVAVLALIVYAPRIPLVQQLAEQARLAAIERQRQFDEAIDRARFVFVAPRLDTPAPAPPPRAELSDQDRVARTMERASDPANELPFARGNSSERVESQEEMRARGQGPGPEPSEAPAQRADAATAGSGSTFYDATGPGAAPRSDPGLARTTSPGGALGNALRNLDRYVQSQSFDNPRGGGAYGPAIQFDTKGVEFGPWIRRFIAQIKRNWFIPYAAMSMSGHTVLTFNVHKDGRITDLSIVGPSSVEAFNNAAFNALFGSNPTQPLPPEYPADKAFFTVTFFYNESPPSQ